ncbi:LruC domain-containing protein [Bacteroides sp.]|uniref:LruC domain-containing protein n=1 Tax=Bacteroides sp. TaxID=29523 RepID=UPI002614F7BD|nr:LruC domain-containing protein [Bacteroides sp.]
MKQMKKSSLVTYLFALILVGLVTGCEKDIYNPDNDKGTLPPKEDYFDFSLKGDVALSVNYGVPGLRALIEVYDENPMLDYKTKKEGISPKYAAYTNIDGSFSGKINIPTAMTEAYLYTNTFGLPTCVKMEASADGFSYNLTKGGASTRAIQGGLLTDKVPYKLARGINGSDRDDNTFSLTTWDVNGVANLNGYITTPTEQIGAANEKVGTISTRVRAYLNNQRDIDGNKSLLREPQQVNIKIPDTEKDGVGINVTFMGEQAAYYNTFGYYYYKSSTTLTPGSFFNIKKYVVFPNVDVDGIIKVGDTAQLKYIDEQGNVLDKFPAGYTIGWFVISNGFGSGSVGGDYAGARNGYVKTIESIGYTVAADAYSKYRMTCMSDDTGSDRRFISAYDQKSKLYVVGVEDQVRNTTPDDYMDVMFLVQTSKDLGAGDLEPIPPTDPKPGQSDLTISGTLAFEDIWPAGGDYDLNDVIVEYERKISFGEDNKATKVVETFKPVHPKGSALQNNFFACQYKTIGTVTSLPSGIIQEPGTNSFVITESALNISGNTYVVERDLTNKGLSQDDVIADFNPYIITKEYTTTNRIEVHLPLKDMTSAANSSLMNETNAYYVSEDGKYPFAIDIPITGFKPATERARIDAAGEYPNFKLWTEDRGTTNKDWYNTGKGAK